VLLQSKQSRGKSLAENQKAKGKGEELVFSIAMKAEMRLLVLLP
jgi:hypothetical protein